MQAPLFSSPVRSVLSIDIVLCFTLDADGVNFRLYFLHLFISLPLFPMHEFIEGWKND